MYFKMKPLTYILTLAIFCLFGSISLAQDTNTVNLELIDQSIELSQFRAHHNEGKVEVSWTTLSELNNQQFVLERSSDGQHFEEVMEIPGAGTSCESINYFEVDWSPLPELSYYRLKQIDFNGEHSYSGIVPVQSVAQDQVPGKLFPADEMATKDGKLDLGKLKDREAIVILRNEKGVEFYSKVKINLNNEQLCAVSLDSQIPKGNYLVTASSINEIYSKRLCIM